MEGARRIYQLLRSCPKWSPAEVLQIILHYTCPTNWYTSFVLAEVTIMEIFIVFYS